MFQYLTAPLCDVEPRLVITFRIRLKILLYLRIEKKISGTGITDFTEEV
jgi:hypothetical protein